MWKIPVEELSKEEFEPFGTVIEKPVTAPDASGPGWTWWGETALLASDTRPYTVGYLDLQPGQPRFDWAERHMQSSELIIPVQGVCLVYVAPPEHMDEPDRLPGQDRFRVFRVKPSQAVLLKQGVWHGAPLADGNPANVVVLLLKDSGKLDCSVVRFEDQPIQIVPC